MNDLASIRIVNANSGGHGIFSGLDQPTVHGVRTDRTAHIAAVAREIDVGVFDSYSGERIVHISVISFARADDTDFGEAGDAASHTVKLAATQAMSGSHSL